MDPHRLRLLLELSRRGSMRAVADEMNVTVSTVSQQLAALAREAGTPLTEPVGRRVRLTPAGRRLAGHAVTVLAAIDAARCDLDPHAEPAGTVRVAGFATAIRRTLLPVAAVLADRHPRVRLSVHEHEPAEAFTLLADDRVDLALTYDYTLAPDAPDPTVTARPLWTAPWGLAVPTGDPADLAAHAGRDWIVNSRNTADERVLRALASLVGFRPRVAHRADSLELVHDLIVAGQGVALLPADQPPGPGVTVHPVQPAVHLRAYAVTRAGEAGWPPLALVLGLLG